MTRYKNYWICLFILLVGLQACQKLPLKKDYLSKNANFNQQTVYEPILGRTTLVLTQFNADNSTYPLDFTIINARHASDGSPAPELFQLHPVQEWERNYTGLETSLAQIDSERIWVEKPFLEIRKGSGDFIFWNSSSTLINTYPDSGYLFDIKVTNNGNARVFTNFYLRPLKEIPYEPYEYDEVTRQRLTETRTRPDGTQYTVPFTIHPSFLNNMYYTPDSLFTDTLVSVYFHKSDVKFSGHSLTFKFLDQNFNPINPDKFDETDWATLIHGFNMQMDSTQVTYQVAYPIPLTTLTTQYATAGQAHVTFGYGRKGYGGARIDASFGLNFSIYEPGDWTIIFYFRRNPLFTND